LGSRSNVLVFYFEESRFCPTLHVHEGLTPHEVLTAVVEGHKKASETLGIRSGIIVCAMRHHSVAEAETLAKLAAEFQKDGMVVGFDIAGPESGFKASLFREAYDIASKANLGLTAHAGEAHEHTSIQSAVKKLHVTRIGHGISMKDHAETRQLVKDKNVLVECCITSNLLTKAVLEPKLHPLKQYLDAGISATLATDGVIVTDTCLSEEYLLAQNALGLTPEHILQIVEYGFLRAFQPTDVCKEMARDAVEKTKILLNQ